jgi:hypothetical protein
VSTTGARDERNLKMSKKQKKLFTLAMADRGETIHLITASLDVMKTACGRTIKRAEETWLADNTKSVDCKGCRKAGV